MNKCLHLLYKFLGIEQRPWLWEQRLSIWDPNSFGWCYVQAHEALCAEQWGQMAGTSHCDPLFKRRTAPHLPIPDSKGKDALKRSEGNRNIQSLGPPEDLQYIRESPQSRQLPTLRVGDGGGVGAWGWLCICVLSWCWGMDGRWIASLLANSLLEAESRTSPEMLKSEFGIRNSEQRCLWWGPWFSLC